MRLDERETFITIDAHTLDVLVFAQTLFNEVYSCGSAPSADRNAEQSYVGFRVPLYERRSGSMSMEVPPCQVVKYRYGSATNGAPGLLHRWRVGGVHAFLGLRLPWPSGNGLHRIVLVQEDVFNPVDTHLRVVVVDVDLFGGNVDIHSSHAGHWGERVSNGPLTVLAGKSGGLRTVVAPFGGLQCVR